MFASVIKFAVPQKLERVSNWRVRVRPFPLTRQISSRPLKDSWKRGFGGQAISADCNNSSTKVFSCGLWMECIMSNYLDGKEKGERGFSQHPLLTSFGRAQHATRPFRLNNRGIYSGNPILLPSHCHRFWYGEVNCQSLKNIQWAAVTLYRVDGNVGTTCLTKICTRI